MTVKALRKQLMAAIAMVVVAAVALSSSTYAWFANSNTVNATGMSVTAKSDSSYLLIKAGSATVDQIQTAKKTTDVATNPSGALLPTAHKTFSNIAGADSYNNWYYKYASSPDASAAAEDATEQTITEEELNKYVLINEFNICTATGSNAMQNLKIKDLDVTTSGDSAVKVIIASESSMVELGVGENQSDDTILATNVDDNSVVKIKIYIYWDGDDADVYTNGIADLKSTSVNVEFTATPIVS